MSVFRFLIVALALLAITAGAASAQPVRGDDEEVANEQCSAIRSNGSIHSGTCKTVCKGRKLYIDATRQYGNKYYCYAAAKPSGSQLPIVNENFPQSALT
jgi:hypothetical protein